MKCLRRDTTRRKSIIIFFGPNGAGKSIQMDLLVYALENRNTRVRKSWIASHHLFVWFLGLILAKLGYPKDHWTKVNPHLPPYVDFSFLTKRMGKISRLFLITLEVLNIVLVDLFKVRIPRLLGYHVIIEKYFLTSITDLGFIFGWEFLETLPARLFLKLIPKDAYCIFLNASYETTLKRRGTRTEPRKYLEMQSTIGRWYANHYDCLTIDTSKTSIKRTHELIMKYLSLS